MFLIILEFSLHTFLHSLLVLHKFFKSEKLTNFVNNVFIYQNFPLLYNK